MHTLGLPRAFVVGHPGEEDGTTVEVHLEVSLWGTVTDNGCCWSEEQVVVRETTAAGGTGPPRTEAEPLTRTSPEEGVAGVLFEGDRSTVSMVCPRCFICPGWFK